MTGSIGVALSQGVPSPILAWSFRYVESFDGIHSFGLSTGGCPGHSAFAGGLDFPEQGTRSLARGGAFSAQADDPTAAFIDPGALSKQRGYRLMYSHNLVWEFTEFTRSPSLLERPEYQMNTLKPGRRLTAYPIRGSIPSKTPNILFRMVSLLEQRQTLD